MESTESGKGFEITITSNDILNNNIDSEEKLNLYIESKLEGRFLEVFKNPILGEVTTIAGKTTGSKTWDGMTIIIEYYYERRIL